MFKDFKVILDPGHGGSDWGLKTGEKYNQGYMGLLEKDINLEVANRVAWFCANHGIGYILTRYGDRFIGLPDRIRVSNNSKAKLFISIHCNYALNEKVRGVETWYFKNSNTGKNLAKKLQEKLLSLKYTIDRKIQAGSFFVLRNSIMPAVLVELGFLQNKDDALFLADENNQNRVAYLVFEFIKENI